VHEPGNRTGQIAGHKRQCLATSVRNIGSVWSDCGRRGRLDPARAAHLIRQLGEPPRSQHRRDRPPGRPRHHPHYRDRLPPRTTVRHHHRRRDHGGALQRNLTRVAPRAADDPAHASHRALITWPEIAHPAGKQWHPADPAGHTQRHPFISHHQFRSRIMATSRGYLGLLPDCRGCSRSSQLFPGRQGSAQMVVCLMSLPSSMRWPGTS
jgi:hypothetical protein